MPRRRPSLRRRRRAAADRARARSARHTRPSQRGEWAFTVFLAALIGLGVAIVAVIVRVDVPGGNESAVAADVEPERPSVRAHDAERHVVFRRSVRRLTIKLGKKAPRQTKAVRGRAVRLSCGYLTGSGSSLYQRRVRWPRKGRFVTVTLPGEVAATTEFCSLRRGGRTLAHATFGG